MNQWENPPNILLGNVGEVTAGADAGVVHKDVAAAEYFDCFVVDLFALFLQGDVSLNGIALYAERTDFFSDKFRFIPVNVGNQNIGASLGKAESECLADTVGAAGYNCFESFIISDHFKFSFESCTPVPMCFKRHRDSVLIGS